MAEREELPADQSLTEHLDELRKRLIRSLLGVAVGFAICWTHSAVVFDFIRRPILPYLPSEGLVFTAPMDKFMAHLKISVLAGVLLSLPWWLYQVWAFVAPGLYRREKKLALGFIFFGTLLFLAGAAFVYFIVYPMAFEYLMNFGGSTDKPMITIESYISFFISTTFIFGICFELPLVLVVLGMLGVIDHHFLRTKRRYAIVLMAVVAAIITPPDLLSMLFLLVPLMALYEVGILILAAISRKNVAHSVTTTDFSES